MEPTVQTASLLLDLAPYIVAVVGSLSMALAAFYRYRKSPLEAVAVKSDAIEKLTGSVEKLTIRLGIEREARLEDCIEFEQGLGDLRKELSDKYDSRLYELKAYYEERISRLEQGHKDVVKVLKSRIKELESRLDNGDLGI